MNRLDDFAPLPGECKPLLRFMASYLPALLSRHLSPTKMKICSVMSKLILRKVKIMTKYRVFLWLKDLGFNELNIALSIPCSRNTVFKVLKHSFK